MANRKGQRANVTVENLAANSWVGMYYPVRWTGEACRSRWANCWKDTNMPNLNRVFLMGNLTRDVELKSIASGQQVANLGLAINRRWKDPNGQDREEVVYVDCEAWGRTAETLAKYLAKGKPVFIEGRLKLDQWEKEGQKHSKLRVVVEGFQFVDGKASGAGGGGNDEGGGTSYSRPAPRSAPAATTSAARPAAPAGMDMPESDDIPF